MPPSRIVSLFFVALLDERMTDTGALIAGSRFRLHALISKRMDRLLDLVDFTALFIAMVYEDDEQAV
jgi:hypothetical protein